MVSFAPPPDVRTQVIGLGPAGLGLALAADRLGRFGEALDHGLVFLEQLPDAQAIRQRSLAYVISSNSPANDFLTGISPDGAFAAALAGEAGRQVRSYQRAILPLQLVADLMGDLIERLVELCAHRPPSAVLFGAPVAQVNLLGDGRFVSLDASGRALARSSHLVLAMGAEENLADVPASLAPAAVRVPSEDLLRGELGAIERCLDREPAASIVILGGAHSGFASASVILQRLGARLRPGQVSLVHKGIALYEPPERQITLPCDSAGPPAGPGGEANRFRGLRGDARSLYDAVCTGREHRVRLLTLPEAAASEILASAAVLVQAIGYEPRRLPILSVADGPIDLGWERRRLAVDQDGRVLDARGRVVPNLFGIGTGSCPMWFENQLQVGVNLFHGPHATRLIQLTLPSYRGGKPMSSKKTFGKAVGTLPNANEMLEWTHQLKRGRVPGPRMEHNKLLPDDSGVSTKAVHAGTYVDPSTGAVGTPIFQTTTFLFSEHTYASFAEGVTRDVPIYTRYGNPNQWSVQEKLASLEGAESTVVFSSGMAAIATTLQALTNHGGHIITSYDVYGGTYNLLREDMHQLGREVSFIDPTDPRKVAEAIKDNTQILFFETLTNPLLKPTDIDALGEIARQHQLLLVVDNTFLSPVFLRPIQHGAHLVIHSGTKYLNGHSDLTCGCVSGSRKYVDRVWSQMLKSGGSLDAWSCFLLERGLKTLGIRMRTHHANAAELVQMLAGHPKVRRVHHPLAPDYAYPWISRLCPDGFGGVLSFELAGGDAAALKLLDELNIPAAATSLGGVESLVSLPFNTSHSSLTAAQRAQIGIMPGLVRFSVGIEDAQDLTEDLERALRLL